MVPYGVFGIGPFLLVALFGARGFSLLFDELWR